MFRFDPNKRRKITRTLVICGFPALAYGFFGFFFLEVGVDMGWVREMHVVPKSFEFPLQGLLDVSVDAHGNVYCALMNFSRLQVYDSSGRFLRGWFVPSASGVFVSRPRPDGRVDVGTARGGLHVLYTPRGNLIWEKVDAGSYTELKATRSSMKGNPPARYEIAKGILGADVRRMDADGTWETVVRSSVWKSLLVGRPAWCFYSILGLITLGIAQRMDPDTVDCLLGHRRRRRKSRTEFRGRP